MRAIALAIFFLAMNLTANQKIANGEKLDEKFKTAFVVAFLALAVCVIMGW